MLQFTLTSSFNPKNKKNKTKKEDQIPSVSQDQPSARVKVWRCPSHIDHTKSCTVQNCGRSSKAEVLGALERLTGTQSGLGIEEAFFQKQGLA